MALPKLNVTPSYQLTIPSTGKKVSYRPYLVKEEKILLMAFESKETKAILRAMLDTIKACIEDDVDVSTLATFDVEYMFLQIRSKSVGETSTIVTPCKECKSDQEVVVPIDSVKVDDSKKVDYKIELSPGIWVEMRYPTYTDLINSEMVEEGHTASSSDLFDMIANGISAILTEEERFDAKDQTKEELMDFIDSLTSTQLAKLNEFFEGTPQLKHDHQFICQSCGAKNELHLSGMGDFF